MDPGVLGATSREHVLAELHRRDLVAEARRRALRAVTRRSTAVGLRAAAVGGLATVTQAVVRRLRPVVGQTCPGAP